METDAHLRCKEVISWSIAKLTRVITVDSIDLLTKPDKLLVIHVSRSIPTECVHYYNGG